MRSFFLLSVSLVFFRLTTLSQSANPDSTQQVFDLLADARAAQYRLLADQSANQTAVLERMLELGMWSAVDSTLSHRKQNANSQLLRAELHILNNDFFTAATLVNKVLKGNPSLEKAIRLRAYLDMQAWRLDRAASRCQEYLAHTASEKMSVLLGKIYLLQKKYPETIRLADELLKKNPSLAAAYLLKADAYFWNQQPAKAEAPLLTSLTLDPFNADARFSYGYAIWRRIDATQLNAMAAQWEIALAVNPLHFQTHWHWGNGHTNLTYADYAEPAVEAIRQQLKKADSLFQGGQFAAAINYTSTVENENPQSVIPLLHRASLYYSNFDDANTVRLDSAEQLFRRILTRKKHFGPAHNGLAAVIKSKRIPFLANYDSISRQLKNPAITDKELFTKVFPDVAYYPGTIAKGMVWNQLYTAVVYFPFLRKMNKQFHVPPLHIDLATAMGSSYFRVATTFDNRQWMDIRGVGSGAAAIEYVERGAYGERNVLLHEYVHLFHGTVLTDEENRAIRARYYQAMKENRTLDYYSQNNESEYLAQTYPAYFEAVKVHPLDFKSMNTTNDLKQKDPMMYVFLDKLIKKEQAYLAGDQKAMASNWAEVYLQNSRSPNTSIDKAMLYLDTALSYDANYLPAIIAYAGLQARQKKYSAAAATLTKAQQLNEGYAPVYLGWAALAAARVESGDLDQQKGFAEQEAWLDKAKSLETDFLEQARINGLQRLLYQRYAHTEKGIAIAEEYIQQGSAISTYLRDRKDDARAYAAALRAANGEATALNQLKSIVLMKPQQYEYRKLYATALIQQKQYETALTSLQEAQRILAASGNGRLDFDLLMADALLGLQRPEQSQLLLQKLPAQWEKLNELDRLQLVRVLVGAGQKEQAKSIFAKLAADGLPAYVQAYQQTAKTLL